MITGIVCSDRWSVYNKLPLNLHQICWAHLKRDFQKLVDRGGPTAEAIGRVGLDVVECLFADWWAFRRGELDRPGLQARLDRIRAELQGVLEQGCSSIFAETWILFSQSLGTVSGVVVVRLDRRCRAHEQPCGTHPALGRALAEERLWLPPPAGCRFVERMLSVVQTLRLQKRPVLDYLYRAIMAHRSGLPAPQLLGQAGD